jgi:hypothetical protein
MPVPAFSCPGEEICDNLFICNRFCAYKIACLAAFFSTICFSEPAKEDAADEK